MAHTNFEFLSTKNIFREYLSGYSINGKFNTITYNDWKNADEDDKASLLFVIFYDSIALAWHKCITLRGIVYVDSADGVSTVLQYLVKNVDKINADEKRYDPKYIYKVCYNCLLSLCETHIKDKMRSSMEISNEYSEGNVAVNLWDLVPSLDDDIETAKTKEAIWMVIRHMGPKAEKVVNHLINPDETYHRLSSKSSERPLDRLADVSVSKKEYEEIVDELKIKLAPFMDAIMQF